MRVVSPPIRRTILIALMAFAPGCYLFTQSAGQISMLMRREPIARVIADPATEAVPRDRLQLVLAVKYFAEHSLGLRASSSYTQLVRLDRDAVSYAVSASPRDRLEPYTWWFPIVGRVPYKGYFDRRDADREARRLAAQGFDVFVGQVPAYSLLGWFPDPLYSPMLRARRDELASTVLHELTHGTVFLAGRASFNEGFAEFVGQRGAMLYLERRYGRSSFEVREALAAQRDDARFAATMRATATKLRELYASPVSFADKVRRRETIFAETRVALAATAFETPDYAHADQLELNNAVLMTFVTYNGAADSFRAVYERFGSDLPRFVAFFRDHVAHERDPEAYLERIASDPSATPTARH